MVEKMLTLFSSLGNPVANAIRCDTKVSNMTGMARKSDRNVTCKHGNSENKPKTAIVGGKLAGTEIACIAGAGDFPAYHGAGPQGPEVA
jgi:hypothetical protein